MKKIFTVPLHESFAEKLREAVTSGQPINIEGERYFVRNMLKSYATFKPDGDMDQVHYEVELEPISELFTLEEAQSVIQAKTIIEAAHPGTLSQPRRDPKMIEAELDALAAQHAALDDAVAVALPRRETIDEVVEDLVLGRQRAEAGLTLGSNRALKNQSVPEVPSPLQAVTESRDPLQGFDIAIGGLGVDVAHATLSLIEGGPNDGKYALTFTTGVTEALAKSRLQIGSKKIGMGYRLPSIKPVSELTFSAQEPGPVVGFMLLELDENPKLIKLEATGGREVLTATYRAVGRVRI